MKSKITILDFNLFVEAVKSLSKFAEAAKFTVDNSGLTVYSKNNCARFEIATNSVMCDELVEFNVMNLQTLYKILVTIKDIHENDFTTFNFTVDGSAIRFESKKFKTKLMIGRDTELIEKWLSKKLVTPLTPILEIATTTDMIKRLNSHSFIFNSSDASSLRIYLVQDKDLEKNTIYATLGNETNNLNNSITLKFGLVTFGTLDNRKLILDFERMNMFNIIPANDLKIQLMDKNVLVCKSNLIGKNNSFLNMTIYNSLRKS